MKRLFYLIILGVGGAYLFREYVGGIVRVASGSMEPTLKINSIRWVDKWHYKEKPAERGVLVIFPSPVAEKKKLIKRVIAVGGDSIGIRDKKVFINWEEIEEPYVSHTRPNEILAGDNIPNVTVPQGFVFVMGDNRDSSEDSRDWKDKNGKPVYFIPVESIKGRINVK